MMSWHLPAGSTGTQPETVAVTPERAGWGFSGLRVVELPPGGRYTRPASDDETVVLPLAGSCTVTADGDGGSGRAELAGRRGVFAGVSDYAFVPWRARTTITSARGGRFALASARARRALPFRHVPATSIPVELRGAGNCSRQVNNFAMPGVLEADRLIACEVLTPAGNWSSYPPHKHDTAGPGETELEEIYYFEVADGAGHPGLAYQRVYGTPERPADLLAEVRSGDVVLIPHGWHGPSMAVPGYHLYYLNVMAGPGQREWRACDDPAHGWVRGTWASQPADPRLPLTGTPS
ncbi:MAG TPA: 5-deoxy-glucuronate isomerase [Streptosporangiaceae bacterium]|nr:5-deoxy-glucuronate isomerase [Streptosporangiaceae bacterium]